MDELIDKKSEILRTPSEKFNFSEPQIHPVELYNRLGNKLIEKNGVGLAAPQIGLSLRVFVIRSDPIMGFFNPTIVSMSEETEELEEGCLTFPGIFVKVRRAKIIKVRFADALGKVDTKKFQDFTARIIQHEMDHLNGILLGQLVGPVSLQQAILKAKKLGFNYVINDLK